MAKKILDNLSLDMIQCEKDGYGVHYGKWKAMQKPVEIEQPGIPEGWLVCQYCGIPFKPKTRRPQKYCQHICGVRAMDERRKKKKEGSINGQA